MKISTDGKILIIGKLNFAHDLISISGRLYADLSKISSGNVTVLFLADIPDQVRLLTIYGKLKMGFTNASGQEVTFDVVDAPASTPAGTAVPTGQLVDPARAGGNVDINVVNGYATNPISPAVQNYLDVTYQAPSGASLDYGLILSTATAAAPHFTVSGPGVNNATLTIIAMPTPMATLTLDDGVTVVPLTFDPTTNTVWRWGPSREVYGDGNASTLAACKAANRVGCRIEGVNVAAPTAQDPNHIETQQKTTALARETVATAADLPAGTAMSAAALLAAASRKIGTNRFRYALVSTGNVAWRLGAVTVAFPAGAFKNADVKLADGTTTTGASSLAFSQSFTVQGATAQLVDPGAGGTIDVNVLNDRDWIDVEFVAATGLKIDTGSITDLDPEFTLSGPGVGSITLDNARAPYAADRRSRWSPARR